MSLAKSNDQDWENRSKAWKSNSDWIGEATLPVTDWLVEAVAQETGGHVLELAAGTGDPGIALAERLGDQGKFTITDRADEMLDGVRERVQDAGLENVELLQTTMEDIGLPDASVQSIVCRFGFMLSTDIPKALAEAHRVLAPGGRLALAVWSSASLNPLFTVPSGVLKRMDLAGEAPPPKAPGPLRLSDRAELREVLDDAGFASVQMDDVDVSFIFPSVPDAVDALGSLRPVLKSLFAELPQERADELRSALVAGFEERASELPDGRIAIPGAVLVATADRPE